MMTRWPIIRLILLVASAASVPALAGQTSEQPFWDIAEGYTAERVGGAMRVSWRMFSAPDPICEDVPSDIELSAPTAPTTLVAGEPVGFYPTHLHCQVVRGAK